MAHVAALRPALVLFTGDMGQAGLAVACSASSSAQAQLLANTRNAYAALRAALPGVPIYGVYGNHDRRVLVSSGEDRQTAAEGQRSGKAAAAARGSRASAAAAHSNAAAAQSNAAAAREATCQQQMGRCRPPASEAHTQAHAPQDAPPAPTLPPPPLAPLPTAAPRLTSLTTRMQCRGCTRARRPR
jgi:hypothetical protein